MLIINQMKVFPFTIPKKPKENIIVQEDITKTFFDRLHQHSEIQISHIIAGKGKLVVGNTISRYNKGDTFAIGSKVPHLFQSTESQEKSHMISVFFLPNAFGHNFFDLPEMEDLTSLFEVLNFGVYIKQIEPELFKKISIIKNTNRFFLFMHFLELLKTIATKESELLSQKQYQKRISNNQGTRLQVIFDFVIKNFNQNITLTKVAAMAHMSPNAFCRFFKQRCNKSFFTFVTEVRVAHACQLLLDENDLSIGEIALKSGFNSISNFNKQFKATQGMSPLKYVKSFSEA